MRRPQKTERSGEPNGEPDAEPDSAPTARWTVRITVAFWIAGLIAFLVYAITMAVEMQQPPGCLYGCDVYFHKGLVDAFLRDPNPFVAHTAAGELAYYPGLMHALAALVAATTGASTTTATFILAASWPLAMSGFVFASMRALFGLRQGHALLALLPLVVGVFHPADATAVLCGPALVLAVLLHQATGRHFKAVLMAATLCSLTHVSAMVMAVGFVCAHVASWCLVQRRERLSSLVRSHLVWSVVLALAVLAYWMPLIVQYGLAMPNPYQAYAGRTLGVSGLPLVIAPLTFLAPSSWIGWVALGGLLASPWIHRSTTWVVALFMIVYAALAALFVARGDHLVAMRFAGILPVLHLIGLAVAIAALHRWSGRAPVVPSLVLAALLAGIVMRGVAANASFFDDRWHQQALAPSKHAPLEQILKSLPDHAVVLSNSETSFALFALSGRPMVLLRPSHASPFVDYAGRAADIATLLYTADAGVMSSIIARYDITHAYIDGSAVRESLAVPLSRESSLPPGAPRSRGDYRFDPSIASGITEVRAMVPFRPTGVITKHLQQANRFEIDGQVTGILYRVVP